MEVFRNFEIGGYHILKEDNLSNCGVPVKNTDSIEEAIKDMVYCRYCTGEWQMINIDTKKLLEEIDAEELPALTHRKKSKKK